MFKNSKNRVYKINILIFTLISIFLVILDQAIKLLIEKKINLFESFVLIPNILKITYLKNYGAAFGIFLNMRLFLILITTSILVLSIYIILKFRISRSYYLLAFSMLISGGIGNLIDRVFKGYVIDYCNLIFWPFKNFAIFNLADFLTTVGCFMLFFKILFSDVDLNLFLNRFSKKDS